MFVVCNFPGSLVIIVVGMFHTVICNFELAFGMYVGAVFDNQCSGLRLARSFSYSIQIIVLSNYYNFY